MINIKTKEFNPILFLMSLGSGGLSIAFWAFINFTIDHGKGLIKYSQVHSGILNAEQSLLYSFLELCMIIFVLIHLVTLVILLFSFFKWKSTKSYKIYMDNPLTNNGIMAMFLAINMTLNIFFMIGNYFLTPISNNFQAMMFPGLIIWLILYLFIMRMSITILKKAFTTHFDIDKMHFGFLLHPFALAMLAVTGTAIAGMANNSLIAHTAFFLTLVVQLPGILLLSIKLISMFQHHFKNSMPDVEFLPSTFLVMPTVMLFGITFIRIGHYLHHQFDVTISNMYYALIAVSVFAFMTWYLLFGIILLKDYFKNHFKFHVTQWSFVCPLVAYSVIGIQVYAFWVQTSIIFYYILIILIITSIFYIFTLIRQIKNLNN